MKYKKISLLLLLFVITITSQAFGVEYLNSCGKTSGWTNGETYILNFTNAVIPSSQYFYSSTSNRGYYCFLIGQNTEGITFTSPYNISLISNIGGGGVSADVSIILYNRANIGTDLSFSNLNIEKDEISFSSETINRNVYLSSYLFGQGRGNTILNNVTIKNFFSLMSGTGYSGQNIGSISIDNSYIDTTRVFGYEASNVVKVVNSSNTFFVGDNFLVSTFPIFLTLNIDNSVIALSSDNLTTYQSGSIIQNSMIRGIIGEDANNDGVFDTPIIPAGKPSTYFQNLRIYLELFDILFIQDADEGNVFVTNAYETIVPINDETIGSPNTLTLTSPNVLESSFIDYTFSNPLGIVLESGSSINCGILSSDFCQMTDNGFFSINIKYRGFIQTQSNTEIQGINFYKTAINLGHIISNNADTIYNNIQIHDNVFVKDRVGGISYVETASNEMIKLRGNNINIYENIFTYSDVTTGTASVFLYVSATNDASNNVFNNTFQNSAINQSNEIFGIKCDTRFYNNYLESGINLSNNCVGLDATPLVWFPYTDGKIYGYWLGNYYEDNVGCIDADGDDFCDASYQSGTITDFYPLAVYPFDFTAQLLTADYIINNTLIDITLTRVSNNQTFEIPNTNGVIELGFIQESQFPDLICDFILDGVPVPNQTIIGGVSGQEYFIELTLWSERSYSYKVECYNDFNAENSGDIIFNVEFEDSETPNGNGNGEGIIGEGGVGNIGDIFNAENLGESGDAISDLFNLASQPIGWLILLGFVLLAFSFLGLIFGLVLWLVR